MCRLCSVWNFAHFHDKSSLCLENHEHPELNANNTFHPMEGRERVKAKFGSLLFHHICSICRGRVKKHSSTHISHTINCNKDWLCTAIMFSHYFNELVQKLKRIISMISSISISFSCLRYVSATIFFVSSVLSTVHCLGMFVNSFLRMECLLQY